MISAGPLKSRPRMQTNVLCRMNAGTSRTYVSTGRDAQSFSDVHRSACELIAANPKTPKYAAIDVIMWPTLTDPNISALKPGSLMGHIFDVDDSHGEGPYGHTTPIVQRHWPRT